MSDQPGRRDPEPNGDRPPADRTPVDPWADADRLEPGAAEPGPVEPGPAEPGPAEPGPIEPGPGGAVAETVEQAGLAGGPEHGQTQPYRPQTGETQPYAPVDETAPVASVPPRWSARASVPQPGVEEPGAVPAGWVEEDLLEWQPRRSVATPILITAAVIIVLLILGIGAYLLLNGGREAPVTPPTTAPVVPTITSTPKATTPPAQTTTPPPTTVAPVLVEVPAITGIDYLSALAALTERGLFASRVNEANPDVPAGTVIRIDPEAGAQVESGSVITVVVSTGPPPTTEASPSATQ